MKTKIIAAIFFPTIFTISLSAAHDQLLKKLGDRLEEKINHRAEQKADEAMDKGIDKAEASLDEAAKQAANTDRKSLQTNKYGPGSTECGNYYYLVNNNEVEMTAYDRRDHPAVIITYHISEVKDVAGGRQSEVRSEAKDPKGKILGSGEGLFKCENGNLSADMHMAMSAAPMEQFQGMEVKATQAYLVYPGNMSIGETLPAGAFHMDMYRKGNLFAQADMSIADRKVEEKEQVTTPAGTWKCYRIGYTLTMTMKMGLPISMHYKVTEWFAPGFGIVKTVNYNKKGKVAGHAELTRIE